MNLWKDPPIAKVYEALSALADGRVLLNEGNRAAVTSSNHDKTYSVAWTDGFASMSSNDNASFWQGYAGYPIVAVLLAAGAIPYDASLAQELAGVEWNKLNKEYKRDYDKAVDSVLGKIDARGGHRDAIVAMVQKIYADLTSMEIEKARSK